MDLHTYIQCQHMARKKSQPTFPSFARCIDAKVRRQEYAAATLRVLPFSHLARRRAVASEFIRGLGYRTPAVLEAGFALRYFPRLVGDLDRFVIKPVHATNAWGVATLVRVDERHWKEITTGEVLDYGELLEVLNRPMRKYGFPDKWQIEELLLPVTGAVEPLIDYKFYAFHGEVGLVLQAHGRGEHRRYKWSNAAWCDVRTGKYSDRIDETIPMPREPDALMTAARAISGRIPIPFCRIDMYETSSGVYVGELTPEPGGYHEFDPGTDEALGAMYEQAEARIASAEPKASAVLL